MSEQYTEDLIKSKMQFELGSNPFGYVYPQGAVDNVEAIKQALQKAGGKPVQCELEDYSLGGKGSAKPEFIITFNDYLDLVVVIEAKKDVKYHSSPSLNKPKDYALDGSLYYAKFLKEFYNVIFVAVSGTKENELKVSSMLWRHNALSYEDLKLDLMEVKQLVKQALKKEEPKESSLEKVKTLAILFHDMLRESGFSEKEKPLFVAGILISLNSPSFQLSYDKLPTFQSLASNLEISIKEVLNNYNLKDLENSFSFIKDNTKLATSSTNLNVTGSLKWYIDEVFKVIYPMLNTAEIDALGVFYHEFTKYSGGDGKGLGIVLTPNHIADFMVELAEINKDSKVLDICCGTGSFLMSSLKKTSSVIGIELNHDLYLLALTSLITRKDIQSKVFKGDCFTVDLTEEKATNGLINPPYGLTDKKELEFVEYMLDNLTKGGTGVAIVPMSCAIGTKFKEVRERLFTKHTLKAVFSMPDDLFYPSASTNTCIMTWEAHKPHNSELKTFFGYFKDDGFVKRKNKGRVDAHNKWEAIKKKWLDVYRNSEVIEGLSAKQEVTHKMEWLCEAYMKTDYSILTQEMFEKTIKDYVAYKVAN